MPDLKRLKDFYDELLSEFKKHAYERDILCCKKPLSQLIELVRLRIGAGKLIPEDYYRYRLYDDNLFSNKEKKLFASQEAIPDHLCKSPWNLIANDKLLFYKLLESFGAPLPNTVALFHGTRRAGSLLTIRTEAELRSYVLEKAKYPFVIKPIDGIYSQDVMVVRTLNRVENSLTLGDNSTLGLDAFVEKIGAFRNRGMLLQDLLFPHPIIEQACGPRICTLRMITISSSAGAELLYGLWKIVVGTNMADNYWRGNLLAPVDLDTGEVGRCVQGMGKDISFHETHPDTGQPLTGLKIPDWQEVLRQCLDLTRCLDGIPIQAWDVALTDNGPVFLEVNVVGSVFLPQLAHQKGFLDERLQQHATTVFNDRCSRV